MCGWMCKTGRGVPIGALHCTCQAIHTVGEALTGAFRQLDEYLEGVKFLPVLEAPAEQSNMLSSEWNEVSCHRPLHSITTAAKGQKGFSVDPEGDRHSLTSCDVT